MHTPTAPEAPRPEKTRHIPFVEPIVRANGSEVTEITLRKPKAGELRGLTISALVNGDVDALIAVVPRIATPYIAEHEVAALEADDIGEIAGALFGFFMRTPTPATTGAPA